MTRDAAARDINRLAPRGPATRFTDDLHPARKVGAEGSDAPAAPIPGRRLGRKIFVGTS